MKKDGYGRKTLCFPLFKNYANKVKISSKLVARITRLPFQADVRKVEYQVRHLFIIVNHSLSPSKWPAPAFQTRQVTTEVFPSEMGEGEIPWWVWLLAAIGGLILLLLIIFCLYKVREEISTRAHFLCTPVLP